MHIICRLFPLFVLSFLFVWYLISSFPFYISRRSPFSPLLFVCFGFGFGVWKLRILSLSPFLLLFFFFFGYPYFYLFGVYGSNRLCGRGHRKCEISIYIYVHGFAYWGADCRLL